MRNDILDKLRVELSSDVRTEAQVLFILVKTRKLLEMRESGPKYQSLSFFCDWALHARLDRGGALNIIVQFDRVVEPYLAGDMVQFQERLQEIEDLMTANRFRQELENFLETNNLPSAIAKDPAQWQEFMAKYLDSITDVPLEIKPIPVKYVQSVSVRPNDELAGGRLFWAVKLFDSPNPIWFPFRL